ncbi:MAG: flagellar hook-basal body complex protein FliE, partial [Leptospiraceae bacterium]|nr:flagellar hook-basal body complex protein FliE [Leptospiraceae bacterium]
ESASENFASVFEKALEKVNGQQITAENLTQQMISEPDSVEAHTVMIAAEKARISLTFTKSLADLAIRTYRELSNLR